MWIKSAHTEEEETEDHTACASRRPLSSDEVAQCDFSRIFLPPSVSPKQGGQ